MSWQGLNREEVQQRLKRDGPNELPSAKRRPFLEHLIGILREPMTSLLAACGIIYAMIGDRQEALVLLGFWALIIFITLYQERKTEYALAALRRLSSPRALVVRDGQAVRIPAVELVVDDILQLGEGDIVPADARLVETGKILLDESMLTGESFPVEKEKADRVWAGTTIVRGHAFAQVFATGARTKMGQIGRLLEKGSSEETRLKVETRQVVTRLSIFAISLCILTALVYAVQSKNILGGILVGLTLAMAILPNELPAVLTIFLALGTRRLSLRNVLTRRLDAVENIGATSVLCVDKTGTLTMNKMSIKAVLSSSSNSSEDILKFAFLASHPNSVDPMERAIAEAHQVVLSKKPFIEFEVSPDLFVMSNLWKTEDDQKLLIASKGAPEAVLDLCSVSLSERVQILAQVELLAGKGLRVLAVARGSWTSKDLPRSQRDLGLEYLGLLGFADPVRPGVTESLTLCYEAGIRVIMITGDHAKTAASIANEIGLRGEGPILTGSEMSEMSDQELSLHLKRAHCFARMVPEQKLRIVKLLQSQGEVVAMTGDGVNDAPALMAAQIGIAMGRKGTDVARESASMVLLDDDFTSIVQGIRMGRGIYDNLQAAMAYLLAVHLPIAGISILPVFLDLPLVLMPVHVAFLHLIIEPASSLVFESEPLAADVMKRKPRGRDEKFFSRKIIGPSIFQGTVVYLFILAIFLVALRRGQGELDARALTFTTLIFANLGLIFINRSWSRSFHEELQVRNTTLWWTLLSSLIFLFMVLYVPALRSLFRLSTLHPVDLFISMGAAFASIAWFELWKRIRKS